MKKMDLIKRYQESNDISEIIEIMNKNLDYKLTESGCGPLIRFYLHDFSFKEGQDPEKYLIERLRDFLFCNIVDDRDYYSLWDPTIKNFVEETRNLIDKLDLKKKQLLEICPKADRTTKACRQK